MKSLLILAASTLALAACSQGPKATTRASLECPQTEGKLTRASISADGRSCLYRSSQGDEVTLQLVATNGDPDRALKTIEAALAPTATAAAPDAAASAAATVTGKEAQAAADEAARAVEQAQSDAAKAAASAGEDIEIAQGPVDVEVHSDGSADGETARIHLPGLHIDAKDEKAEVRVGPVRINAEGDEATVRVYRDVRLKGEAFSRQKRGVRATYIYTGDNVPGGYKAVGYEAGGPKAGPLAVAVVRARDADRNDGDLYDDVQKLVRRNGGV